MIIRQFTVSYKAKTKQTSTFQENRNCVFTYNIPERRFTIHKEKTGVLGTDMYLEKKPNRLYVIPRQMTYLPSVLAQNPILGNGAQLSKMLNLSVKKADIF